jgi:hypothetical protein
MFPDDPDPQAPAIARHAPVSPAERRPAKVITCCARSPLDCSPACDECAS